MLLFKTGNIYLIRNIVNGKCYVGRTLKSAEFRLKDHFRTARRGSNFAIHSAIRLYGESNFTVETLETCDVKALNGMEKYYIAVYDTHIDNGNGYNMTSGGESTSGWRPTNVTIEKIRSANKLHVKTAEHLQKISLANRGQVRSLETRLKMSASQKGCKKPRKQTALFLAQGL